MYVHSILHYWACKLISEGHFIEYVYCWEFVCEIFEILFYLYSLCHISLEWDEWPSCRDSGSLSYSSLHHYWCDFTPCLVWVDHQFSSYIHCFSIILVIACDSSHSLHPLVLFLHWPIPGLIFPLHHSCVSYYQFDLSHRLIIDVIFTLGTLRSMAHELFHTCCILYMRVWFFYHWVFEPSFLSFLLPYHPSLHYVLCLKTALRPGDQMSFSTAPT